ncbi:hypothetical protein GCM10022408_32740 [Hymenobacter fastidiosus]|uniref:Lipocalin-like domain-containing protein n=1 Tax=Hymenobacter fastidiosus TaxID=486264 RepID=A0ABP7SUN3_9BACT
MKKTLLLAFLALGTGSCDKKGGDIAPKPTPEPSLLGQWTAGPVAFAYYNSQGAVTQTGVIRPGAPTTYLNVSEMVWQNTASRPADFLYRRADSTVTTSLLVNGNRLTIEKYAIIALSDHQLILRSQLALTGGGRFVEKNYFSR